MNLLPRLLHRISCMKTRKKLLMIYTLAGILPMFLIGAYSIRNSYSMVIKQYNAQILADNNRVRNILFDVTYLVSNSSDMLLYDNDLKEILSAHYNNEEEVYEAYRGYELMDFCAKNYTELSSINVYATNKTLVNSGRFHVADDAIRQAGWFQKAAASSGEPIWICDNTLDTFSSLRLIRKIPFRSSEDFAVLVISVSNEFFKGMVNDDNLMTLFCLDNSSVFYSPQPRYLFQPLPFMPHVHPRFGADSYTVPIGDTECLVYDSSLSAIKGSNKFQIVTISTDALKEARNAAFTILGIIIISILMPLILILIFTSHFSRRINFIREEMHRISKGDLNIRRDFSGTDELGDLFNDMQMTITSIQKLNEQVYQEKLNLQKSENYQQRMRFELLSSQINPHFLFNTLETIRMKASDNEDYEVAEILRMLGKMMRYTLSSQNQPVPLNKEMEYIRMYLRIQHIRFEDRLDYEIRIHPAIDTQHFEILPLLLQPIVENAVIHGISDMESAGFILIEIYSDSAMLQIKIQDNGMGMDAEQLCSLQESLLHPGENESRSSIGMRNVYHRIKLYYGEAYGFTIDSREETGTTVLISLPLDGAPAHKDMEELL